MDSFHPHVLPPPSQLFTLRVWVENVSLGQSVVRIQVKHVMSGSTRTFREWPQVVAFITARLQEDEAAPPAESDQ